MRLVYNAEPNRPIRKHPVIRTKGYVRSSGGHLDDEVDEGADDPLDEVPDSASTLKEANVLLRPLFTGRFVPHPRHTTCVRGAATGSEEDYVRGRGQRQRRGTNLRFRGSEAKFEA